MFKAFAHLRYWLMSNLVNPDEIEIIIKCKTHQNYMMLANALRTETIPPAGMELE